MPTTIRYLNTNTVSSEFGMINRNVILSDGTSIQLNADSKISYGSNYGNGNRNVSLKGEAFFKSVIFMPMAISGVGSSAIFKFIYEYRPPPLTQIGFLNGLRVTGGQDIDGNDSKNNVIENGNKIGYTGEGCTEPIGWLEQRDLKKFVDEKLFPYLSSFRNKPMVMIKSIAISI